MDFLRNMPTFPFAMVAVLLAIMPIVPQPHLVEKLTMLFSGQLSKPLDIFDLLWHGTPITLFIIKLLFLKNK